MLVGIASYCIPLQSLSLRLTTRSDSENHTCLADLARHLHPLGKVDEEVGHHPAPDVGGTAGPRRTPVLGSETLTEKPGEMKRFAHARF